MSQIMVNLAFGQMIKQMRYLSIIIMLLMYSATSNAYNRNKGFLYQFETPREKESDNIQFEKSNGCFLMLYDDGRYLMELDSYLTDDMSYATFLSSGLYHWSNDSLYLENKKYGYDLIFRSLDSVTIQNVKGYPFMVDKCFTGEMRYLDDYPDYIERNNKSFIDKISSHNSSIEPYYELNYKSYNYLNRVEYVISLKEDSTYTIDYDNLTLSIGTWERNGNLLIMKDNNLNCAYYALIRQNELEAYTIDYVCLKIALK